jgi:hypothetical protein
VYVTVPDPAGAILKRAKEALSGVEGIESVIEPADFARYGLPSPERNPQMGVLLLTGKEGYAFTADGRDPAVVDSPVESLGSHGYLANDPDLRAMFIAAGRGIRSGVSIDSVSTLDLAPTIAQLLGVELTGVEGKVLTDVLTSTSKSR